MDFLVGTSIATAIATILAAGINHAVTWWMAREQKQAAAGYLALQLAIILERFAMDCAVAHSESRSYRSSGGHVGREHEQLPELPSYPDNADWKVLDLSFADRALGLRTDHAMSVVHLRTVYDLHDENELQSEVIVELDRHGRQAWRLAFDLRRQHKLARPALGETAKAYAGAYEEGFSA